MKKANGSGQLLGIGDVVKLSMSYAPMSWNLDDEEIGIVVKLRPNPNVFADSLDVWWPRGNSRAGSSSFDQLPNVHSKNLSWAIL